MMPRHSSPLAQEAAAEGKFKDASLASAVDHDGSDSEGESNASRQVCTRSSTRRLRMTSSHASLVSENVLSNEDTDLESDFNVILVDDTDGDTELAADCLEREVEVRMVASCRSSKRRNGLGRDHDLRSGSGLSSISADSDSDIAADCLEGEAGIERMASHRSSKRRNGLGRDHDLRSGSSLSSLSASTCGLSDCEDEDDTDARLVIACRSQKRRDGLGYDHPLKSTSSLSLRTVSTAASSDSEDEDVDALLCESLCEEVLAKRCSVSRRPMLMQNR